MLSGDFPVHVRRRKNRLGSPPWSDFAEAAGFFIGNNPAHEYTTHMTDMNQLLDRHLRSQPTLGEGAYLAKTAIVLGDVVMGDHSSIWYGAVARGDIQRIEIGHHSNVQDNAVLHVESHLPCVIGNWVTIGHSAIVHACTIGDECLIGMGCTILDEAEIGEQSIVGANALVTQRTKIPPRSLVLGSPAKVVRELTEEEVSGLKRWAQHYVDNSAYCLKHGLNMGSPLAT